MQQRVVDKLIRTLRDWLPADTVGHIRFNDILEDEIFSPIPFSDLFDDTSVQRSILVFNDGNSLLSSSNIIFGP